MRTIGIVFYTTILMLIGTALIIFSLIKLQPQDITSILISLQSSLSSRLIIGLSGILLMLISFSLAQVILGGLQREKTIAFNTASGQVTIALSAIEDLIRRLIGIVPEIKELRPYVCATKKGSIIADLKVVLKTEVNIPELTGRLQDIVKAKIQEALGTEEQPFIKIHIMKIAGHEDRDRKRKEIEKEEFPKVPFTGYGVRQN
ncbi:MAG: alkaline shock response membrane anchor protein AmaP [Candidatus Omnitrophota bacterium]|nr:alkaline shock response membrane anchor protein AmaP [Candidatus Omnitrophota bacterium]